MDQTSLTSQFAELKNIIQSLKDEMVFNNRNMMAEFKTLQTSVQFMSDKFDDMAKENQEMKKEMEAQQQQNNKNLEQFTVIKKENTEMRLRINSLENMSRLSNLEIHGVPEAQNENTKRIAVSLMKLVHPNICDTDVDNCFRVRKIGGINPNSRPNPIVVQLQSKQKRMMVISDRKKLAGKNFHDIGIDATRVYINENLTPFSRQLFYRANTLKKSNGWKYIWTRNGSIKMRKDDNTPVLNIEDMQDLEKIVQ